MVTVRTVRDVQFAPSAEWAAIRVSPMRIRRTHRGGVVFEVLELVVPPTVVRRVL